jgi:hypothetical protein
MDVNANKAKTRGILITTRRGRKNTNKVPSYANPSPTRPKRG